MKCKAVKTNRDILFPAFQFYLKSLLLFYFSTGAVFSTQAQLLTGFKATGIFDEQEFTSIDTIKKIQLCINAPLNIDPKGKFYLVFYALPNGNSIEWTKGKKIKTGDDWHFDIQHIAAQTRFVRDLDKKNNYVVVYLMAIQKSWPSWKQNTSAAVSMIKDLVDSIAGTFKQYDPKLILNGHSGGGSFIFGFLDAVKDIPANVERIAFLDSDYGYNDSLHTNKLITWLKKSNNNKLLVLAYNDSVVIYNGKPLVSATGGTWYKSRLIQKNLSKAFRFFTVTDTAFIDHHALNERIQIILKENPRGLIYHTIQVEKNGYILSLLSSEKFDRRKYFIYFGERAYQKYISE